MRIAIGIVLAVMFVCNAFAGSVLELGEKQKLQGEAPFAFPSCANTGFDPALCLVDWDDDGLLDIMTVDVTLAKGYGGPREVIWFKNTGTKNEPKFGERAVLPIKAICHNVIAVADLDKDGKKDIYICRGDDKIAYNRGTLKEPKFETENLKTEGWNVKEGDGPGTAPVIVDWDNDGRLDIIAGTGHNGIKLLAAKKQHVCFYKNIGKDKEFVLAAPVDIEADGKPISVMEPSPCPIDLKGDGHLDLLIALYGGPVYFYENLAEKGKIPKFGAPKILSDASGKLKGSGGRFNILQIGDLNGDGAMDLVETGEGSRDTIWFWPGKKK